MQRYNHPQTTINDAQRRLLDTIRNSQIYQIVKYEVWMCDDISQAEEHIKTEMQEKAITLPEDYDLDIYIEVAQFDVAREQLTKTLQRNSLTDDERAEIAMLNTLYPTTVAMKGILIDDFEL